MAVEDSALPPPRMRATGQRKLARTPQLRLVLVCLLCARAAAAAAATQAAGSEPVPESLCNRRCKPAFVGDGHCDAECNTEACQFDKGDCDGQWELQRMVVMGEHYTYVDHVEYHKVGPHGKMEKITMEQGRRWEGIDLETQEAEPNWKAWLADKQTLFRSETWEKKADKASQTLGVDRQRGTPLRMEF